MGSLLLFVSVLVCYCLAGLIVGVHGNRFKRIEDRITRIEIEQARASVSRGEALLDIFQKLDDIQNLVNESSARQENGEPGVRSVSGATSNDDSLESLATDVMIMKKAFSEEKARWRREASQMENAIQGLELTLTETVKKDVQTSVQEMSDDIKSYIKNVVGDVKIAFTVDSSINEIRQEILALKDTVNDIVTNCSQNSENTQPPRPSHCLELYQEGTRLSGAYTIYPEPDKHPLLVYCDMDTDGGGWTVFQRREDGSENFYRNWADYASGFGDVEHEFWLGNEQISKMTGPEQNELRVDLVDVNGKKTFAKYSIFRVLSIISNYRLEVGGYSGDAGDSMDNHDGMQFTTKDKDNDQYSPSNCASRYKGAWWYNNCGHSNLNTKYTYGYMYWNYGNELKWTEMKFRMPG